MSREKHYHGAEKRLEFRRTTRHDYMRTELAGNANDRIDVQESYYDAAAESSNVN